MVLKYGKRLFAYSSGNRVFCCLDNMVNELPMVKDTQVSVVDLVFTKDDKHLVGLYSNKQLAVWNLVDSFQLVSSRIIPRAAMSMSVVQDGKDTESVAVGDKTGEAYLFSLPDVGKSMCSLLQHTTSMLTNVAFAPNGQHIITTDRNEKIRISQFPKTAITTSYCMGHESFIAKIAFSNEERLVSICGNGKLCLWKYTAGELLASNTLDTQTTPSVFEIANVADCTYLLLVVDSTLYLFDVTTPSAFTTPPRTVTLPYTPMAATVAVDKFVMSRNDKPYFQAYNIKQLVGDLQLNLVQDSAISAMQQSSTPLVHTDKTLPMEGELTKKKQKQNF